MHEHNNRNRTKWIKQNSIKQYKTKNIVHLLLPYKRKETFRTTYYIRNVSSATSSYIHHHRYSIKNQ